MRNNQQKRMRGRNNTNRRSQNPLTRVYESNGPDVKVRGTAQHIVEKYQQLARDAQASGDPVAAENYLQHAEHYFRIIAAAQAQFGIQGQPFQRSDEDEDEEDFEENGAAEGQNNSYQPREGQNGNYQPREGGQREHGQQREHGSRDGNQRDGNQRDHSQRDGQRDFYRDRDGRRDNRDRNQERGEHREGRRQRDNRPYREPRENHDYANRDPAQQPQPRLGPDVEAEIGLPAFITQSSPAPAAPAPEPAPKAVVKEAAPVEEINVSQAPVAAPPAPRAPRTRKAAVAPVEEVAEDGETRAAPRTRRRRYRSAEANDEASTETTPAPADAGE